MSLERREEHRGKRPGDRVIRRVLIGRRLATDQEHQERVSRKVGLAIFASDNVATGVVALVA